MEAARPRALAAGLLVSALVLLVAHGRGGGERGGATVELDQKAQSKSESVGQQLLKAQEMFDGEGTAPSMRSNLPASVRAIGDETRGPAAPAGGLGLKGMSQKSFERRVTKEVTRSVARDLLRTMRPLKRVLAEQRRKIAFLEHRHHSHLRDKTDIAARLAAKLKTGLLGHLKDDVDNEVKNDVSPKALLRAEKSKAALRKKLAILHAHDSDRDHEKRRDTRRSDDKDARRDRDGDHRKDRDSDKKDDRQDLDSDRKDRDSDRKDGDRKDRRETHGEEGHDHERRGGDEDKKRAAERRQRNRKEEDEKKKVQEGKSTDVRGAVKHKMNSALDGVYAAEKAAHKDSGGERHHRGRSRDRDDSSSSKKKRCDPLAGLYKTGSVSWC